MGSPTKVIDLAAALKASVSRPTDAELRAVSWDAWRGLLGVADGRGVSQAEFSAARAEGLVREFAEDGTTKRGSTFLARLRALVDGLSNLMVVCILDVASSSTPEGETDRLHAREDALLLAERGLLAERTEGRTQIFALTDLGRAAALLMEVSRG